MNILYDATILRFGLNPSCARSGIFVVASELLAEMCRREGPKPDVYVDPQAIFEVRGYFASRSDFRKLKIVNDVNRGILGGLRVWLLMKQVPPAEQRGGVAKKVAWLLYRIFREVSLVLLDLVFSGAEKKVQKCMANDYDAFFSPMYKAPDVIRQSPMKRFTVIYDTIPQVFPEIYGNNPGV